MSAFTCGVASSRARPMEPKRSSDKGATIIIGGDVCPTIRDERYFRAGDATQLWNGYSELWTNADFTLVNLECPLTEGEERIEKAGPHLKASPDCVSFFAGAPVS